MQYQINLFPVNQYCTISAALLWDIHKSYTMTLGNSTALTEAQELMSAVQMHKKYTELRKH